MPIAAALTLALLAAPAAVQQVTVCDPSGACVGEKLDPAAVEAARAFLRSAGFQDQIGDGYRQGTMASFRAVVENAEAERGEPVPEARMERIRRIILDGVEEVVGTVKASALDDAARVYARHFNADELRELTRFQTHPVMVKFRRIEPSFMSALLHVGRAAAQESTIAVEARIKAELDAWKSQAPAPAQD